MRFVILLLAALQIGLFIFFALGPGTGGEFSELMMIEGAVTLTGMALAICLIPALALSSAGRFLGVALALALVPLAALGLFLSNL